MNVRWSNLTEAQRTVLSFLAGRGRPCGIPSELREQLLNLVLIEPVEAELCSLSQYGATVLPETVH